MTQTDWFIMKLEDAGDRIDALVAACQSVIDWNDRTDGFCEPEDVRDVLEPIKAAIAKAKRNEVEEAINRMDENMKGKK